MAPDLRPDLNKYPPFHHSTISTLTHPLRSQASTLASRLHLHSKKLFYHTFSTMVDYFIDTSATAPTGDDATVSIITFGNDLLKASVCPSLGANLSSVQFKQQSGTWIETIHRANDFTKPNGDDWEGKTPVLWPAVGRNFTAAQLEGAAISGKRPDECRYGPDSLEIPLHGFAQNTVWRLVSSTASEETGASVILEAIPSDAPSQNQEWYPYQWKLEMELRITGSDLSIDFKVHNTDTKILPFSIGTHPSFRFPFVPNTDIGETGLSWGSHTNDLKLTPFSCLNGECDDHSKAGSLPASTFCDNVLGTSQTEGLNYMDLISPKEGLGIRISQQKVGDSFDEPSPLYFVNWADAKQGFFCLEPWCGGPNSLNDGSAVQLQPGKMFQWSQTIELLQFDKTE